MQTKITIENLPLDFVDQIEISEIYRNYSKADKPLGYGVDLALPALNLRQNLRASELDLLKAKIESTCASWLKKYERHLDHEHKKNREVSVSEMNQEASAALAELQSILQHTLVKDDAIDFDTLKVTRGFVTEPERLKELKAKHAFVTFNSEGEPGSLTELPLAHEPDYETTLAEHSLFWRIFGKARIQNAHDKKIAEWKRAIAITHEENSERRAIFGDLVANYQKMENAYRVERDKRNAAVDRFRESYLNSDPNDVTDYCDLVLSNSEYPDYFPKNWDLEYRQDARLVVVDYELPEPSLFPDTSSFTYVKSRDAISEKKLTDAAKKKLFESVIYQVAIRTFHELFEADVVNAIDSICFNGLITSSNPATGVVETKTILSVTASKDEFLTFDLENIDPKATFKHLRGVSAASLSSLTPVAPVIVIEKADKRFIDSREVAGALDESVNLASMHWAEFEHLIRELFEHEFAVNGGEVKITQGSSDGGVDAIAFDPDPIRGGKIVIQAKRYTNTVGVSAVRDLYGTVMNEGASKGILVTTSDYGKDSHEFAKGKPLTLLNGSNLLHLLEKHGHSAKIDIKEARLTRDSPG